MINYEKIKNKERTLKALTSLNKEEFEALLKPFEIEWEKYSKTNFINNSGQNPKLKKIEDKLLFILSYFKVYPLQDVAGLLFDLSQSQANHWIHRLTPILGKTFEVEVCMPEREAKSLEKVLDECPGLEFLIDSSERKINRPKDNDIQKDNYSGKSKSHSKKNNIIADAKTRFVKYLSPSYGGKIHDKKICDIEGYKFPKGSVLHKDSGYQGFNPEGVINFQPMKKPRKKELHEYEKAENKEFSRRRVLIENIICSIKICRIVKDKYRNYKENFYDTVMEISSALHNFRTRLRTN